MIQMINSSAESISYGFAQFLVNVITELGGTAELDNIVNPSATGETYADVVYSIYGTSGIFLHESYYPQGNKTTNLNNSRVYYDSERPFFWAIEDNARYLFTDFTEFKPLTTLITKWNGKLQSIDTYMVSGAECLNFYDEPFLIAKDKTSNIFQISTQSFKTYSNIFEGIASGTNTYPKIYPEKVYVMPFMLGSGVADDLYVVNGIQLNPGTILKGNDGEYKALSRRLLYKVS